MEQLTQALEYIRVNPMRSLGAAVAIVVIYFFLNRKSRLVRDAEKRLEELRHERSDQYKKLRPPQ